jgi:flagellar motor switch protein FliN/FliY
MVEGANRMSSNVFSSLEIDAIGEILNISLGASATAVSTMLSRRVDITTPRVSIVSYDEFEFTKLEPAIGVEITYISGLSGSNIMLLKRRDVKSIVEILMNTEIPDEEFELNDLYISAVCEVMNQMMGASSTALSEFLGEMVNISTPNSFPIDDVENFKLSHFKKDEMMVVVSFDLKIENTMESEFINVMPTYLAKKLIAAFGLDIGEEEQQEEPAQQPQSGGGVLSQDEIEKLLQGGAPTPDPQPTQPQSGGGVLSQDEIEKLLQGDTATPTPQAAQPQGSTAMPNPQMAQPQGSTVTPNPQMAQPQMQPNMYAPQMMQPNMYAPQMMQPNMYPPQMMQPNMYPPQEPRVINVQPIQPQTLGSAASQIGEEQAENLNLIMGVPLEISVEIGRTRKMVKDILEFTQGSLVVLDKLAGEQVDLFVNGQCVAKGDVVVVDDNFGIRITEIIKKSEILQLGKR